MKRYSLGLLVVAMVLALASGACAKFPNVLQPDSTATFNVQQGFGPTGQTIWYFCTDTNDINFASTIQYPYRQLTLAAPLWSLYPDAAPMYINTGYQQGPIFSAVPGIVPYSGFWSVVFIRWLPGQARRVCNLNPYNAVTNPFGFPITTPGPTQQATLSQLYGTTRAPAVLDCPIVAVGKFPVTGPWFPGNGANSNPAVFYRLQQVIAFNAYFKTVTLPAFYVYCQEDASRFIDRCTVIVPDVQDPVLAARLKANYAPGLAALDEENSQDFTFIDGRVFGDVPPLPFINGGPVGPLQTVNQYPIIEECPTGRGAQQSNRFYTPLMEFDIFEAGPGYPLDPLIRMICFVNNADYAEFLEEAGVFTEIEDGFINVPVLDCTRILPPGGACCICPDC